MRKERSTGTAGTKEKGTPVSGGPLGREGGSEKETVGCGRTHSYIVGRLRHHARRTRCPRRARCLPNTGLQVSNPSADPASTMSLLYLWSPERFVSSPPPPSLSLSLALRVSVSLHSTRRGSVAWYPMLEPHGRTRVSPTLPHMGSSRGLWIKKSFVAQIIRPSTGNTRHVRRRNWQRERMALQHCMPQL